jgi:hypothetical protein
MMMAVGVDDLSEIERLLARADNAAGAVAGLRRQFPHLSWTSCDASDLTEVPFRSFSKFDIHLLDSADHCTQITGDPARATGIVLADRGDRG